MALAGLDLLRYRIAVARRTAFQHVGDVDLFARESDAGEQLLEQLPGGADERDSLLVLVKAGRLAHEHQIGMRLTRAEDDLGAPLRKCAPRAAGDDLAERAQLVRWSQLSDCSHSSRRSIRRHRMRRSARRCRSSRTSRAA